jgi:hypothetical protein
MNSASAARASAASRGEEENEDDDARLYRQGKSMGKRHVRTARHDEAAAGGHGHTWKPTEGHRRRAGGGALRLELILTYL